jgi:hypothetical protein
MSIFPSSRKTPSLSSQSYSLTLPYIINMYATALIPVMFTLVVRSHQDIDRIAQMALSAGFKEIYFMSLQDTETGAYTRSFNEPRGGTWRLLFEGAVHNEAPSRREARMERWDKGLALVDPSEIRPPVVAPPVVIYHPRTMLPLASFTAGQQEDRKQDDATQEVPKKIHKKKQRIFVGKWERLQKERELSEAARQEAAKQEAAKQEAVRHKDMRQEAMNQEDEEQGVPKERLHSRREKKIYNRQKRENEEKRRLAEAAKQEELEQQDKELKEEEKVKKSNEKHPDREQEAQGHADMQDLTQEDLEQENGEPEDNGKQEDEEPKDNAEENEKQEDM